MGPALFDPHVRIKGAHIDLNIMALAYQPSLGHLAFGSSPATVLPARFTNGHL